MTQPKAPHSNPTNGEQLVKAPASYSPNGPTHEDKMTNSINPNSRSIPDGDPTKIRGMTEYPTRCTSCYNDVIGIASMKREPMTRTVDDVIADWTLWHSGRTRYEGQEPRDDELMLAEVKRLRAEATPPDPKLWRHLNRGTAYLELGRATLQESTVRPHDGDSMIVYAGVDGELWVRSAEEFFDGRFELMVKPQPVT
jgi:hypothetical protein